MCSISIYTNYHGDQLNGIEADLVPSYSKMDSTKTLSMMKQMFQFSYDRSNGDEVYQL